MVARRLLRPDANGVAKRRPVAAPETLRWSTNSLPLAFGAGPFGTHRGIPPLATPSGRMGAGSNSTAGTGRRRSRSGTRTALGIHRAETHRSSRAAQRSVKCNTLRATMGRNPAREPGTSNCRGRWGAGSLSAGFTQEQEVAGRGRRNAHLSVRVYIIYIIGHSGNSPN
jgi:hypothetical protein